MRRIRSACVSQTIRFQQNEPMGKEIAEQANRREYERYKLQMKRSYTKYKIVSERVLEDGALEVQLKKQYNSYDVGGYFGEVGAEA